MADAMVERPPIMRFYCHRCNIEFEDILQDYTCPYCASGFIELLENGENRTNSGQAVRGGRRNPIEVLSNRVDSSFLDAFTEDPLMFPVNNIPPVLQDIAFLMTGGRISMLRATSGREVNTTAPVVLVGAPGDYVFGGDALDAVVTQLLGQLEHSGPPPMPHDVLNSIPSETITEQQVATNASCSVCWENFQLGETISRLECEHIFHSSCITPWLQLHATCPICRRSLLPPARDDVSTTTTTTTTTSTTASTEGTAPRPTLAPRVVIRRSPLYRRTFQTLTWDSPRDMSTSSDSSTSVTTGGVWAPTSTNSGSNSSTSLNDRTQNYHTDFDCD